MSKIQVDTTSPTWAIVERALQPEALNQKILADKFNTADGKMQKAILNAVFGMAVETVSNQPYGNYRCFNIAHEDKTPSMVFDKERGHFHCFGCMEPGENFDVFDAIRVVYGYTSFKDCFNKAVQLFVDYPETVVKTAIPKENLFPTAMYKTMKNPYYTPIQHDADGLRYLASRGISSTVAKKHGVMVWEYEGWLYLVFVNDNGSVVRRCFAQTDDAGMYASQPGKWWNQKGKSGIFNQRVVEIAQSKAEPVFVTESAIDALSIAETGLYAVGLNSVNNLGMFLKECDYPYLIGLFDNDDAGRTKSAIFEQHGYYTVKYDNQTAPFLSQFKDVNEALMADKIRTTTDLMMLQYRASVYYGLAQEVSL